MKVGLVGVAEEREIRQILRSAGHSVVWSAPDGNAAIASCYGARPDVVLLDLTSINTNATLLTRWLLDKSVGAVLLLVENKSERLSAVYAAMGAGALDVVTLRKATAPEDKANAEVLLAKLRTAARLLGQDSQQLQAVTGGRELRRSRLIAIGASTGGPQALMTILAGLPNSFEGSIVIVQHVDCQFSEGLASWLRESSQLRIELARDGDVARPGTALIAGTADHLVMTAAGVFRYRQQPSDNPHRPSIDVLFESLAEHWPVPATAMLLTGMGRDGALGLKRLQERGWYTIAQDEASSVVYGMPKAAAALGAACAVLSPTEIAAGLLRCQ